MPFGGIKGFARGLCPPALWQMARFLCRRFRPARAVSTTIDPAQPYRLVSSVEEIDAEFVHARRATGTSHDAFLQALDAFRFRPPANLPADPDSREYRDAQMAFFRLVSDRDDHVALECEQFHLDEDARNRPFPYYTRSCTTVGEQLMAIGFLIRAMALEPCGRVLEFGFGHGLLTTELARADFRVTGVDINPEYVELVGGICRRNGLQVNLVRSPMLDYRSADRFDRVVFYESFHHCDNHMAMIARLDELVAPGGAVIFGGEPITDDFPMPWGVRPDGRSLWAIRTQGWLELGFRTDYFRHLLERHGWRATALTSADVPWQTVFVATRLSDLRCSKTSEVAKTSEV